MEKDKNSVDLFVSTYHIEMLFDRFPELNSEAIRQELEKTEGFTKIEADTNDFLVFSLPELAVDSTNPDEVPQIVIVKRDKLLDRTKLNAALQQTWDWPEKDATVKRCKYKVVLSDFRAANIPSSKRLTLFNNAVLAVLKHTNCLAIHWVNSLKLVYPESFVSALKATDVQDYLYGALNVRLFPVNVNDGEFLMDTFGLGAFGLPDLQCHFKGMNPEEVAGVLINYGYYIFEKGDVIADGHTVQGANEEQKWLCRHEYSMMIPKRHVLDLNPGGEFSAGNRE